jgi:PAS domain-containing protein
MTSLLTGFFAQQNFIPHGFCLAWDPALLALHVISDSIIAIAYYSIPFALLYFISKRRDLAFRGIFALTGAFILACGTTHVMGVLTLWYPAYWLDGMIKLFTALISIFTAAAIWWAMPKALALPSMAQLEEANRQLEHEIGERKRAQAALRNANAELEQRVAARTAELEEEVAQRRRTEETLRASEQRWRSMFEASAVGIALTDENRRFVAANEAFQKMIGYTAEELSQSRPG